MTSPLSIIFAGTPDFAARHLEALLASEHQIIGVYTQPDRPAGRGKKLTASAVKSLALQHDLPVYQPPSLKSAEAQAQLQSLQADVMVVVAYGLILPQAVLSAPRHGCINVHGSLLPRWRGAAPIQRAIWAGDPETGVTIMQMDKGLDTGDMLKKSSLPIESLDTSATVYEKLAEIGPSVLLETLSALDTIRPEPQNNEQATYAKKLSKDEARMDWHLSASQLARNVRAFNPWPVAFFEIDAGPVKVWQARPVTIESSHEPGTIVNITKQGITVATASDGLHLEVIQLPGKKAMPAADVLNARRDWFSTGTRLA